MPKILIILGAPRSGTTLLRVLLGQQDCLYACPETPWITGAYNTDSVRGIYHYIGKTEDFGAGLQSEFLSSIRMFFEHISPSSKWIVLKTPDDVLNAFFLPILFPDAYYISIHRDGRDVALSTINSWSGDFKDGFGRINFANSLVRWKNYQERIAHFTRAYQERHLLSVSYEGLVTHTENTLESILQKMSLSPTIRPYSNTGPSLPRVERGASDIRRKSTVARSSLNRWKREVSPDLDECIERSVGSSLRNLGYQTPLRSPQKQTTYPVTLKNSGFLK